jgi:hypothetical protein
MKTSRVLSIVLAFCGLSCLIFLKVFHRFIPLGLRNELSHLVLDGNTTAYETALTLPLRTPQPTLATTSRPENDIEPLGGPRLCTRDEIINGAWSPVTLQEPPYVSRNAHLRCHPMEDYQKGFWNTYDWTPSSGCELSQWNESEFCSLLDRGTVLIIGDSLSWEHYSSLAQQLGLKVHQSSQHVSRSKRINHVQLACGNRVRLVFRCDDLLTNVTDAIQSTFPQVVVINRGAHYHNDTRLLPALTKNLRELDAWQSRCQELDMKCHLLWRTSVPGHPHCDKIQFTKPVNNLAEMEAWIGNQSNYDNYTINYHWYDYQHQNELALDLLRQTSTHEYDVIDAYYLNVLRPDEHRAHQNDCLHNCYPGKMDVYNRLLLHYLKIRRSMADVEALVNRYDQVMNRLKTKGLSNHLNHEADEEEEVQANILVE